MAGGDAGFDKGLDAISFRLGRLTVEIIGKPAKHIASPTGNACLGKVPASGGKH
jgi:hypothetical protein